MSEPRPTILVVDDEERNQLVLRAMLAEEPYTLLYANDGQEALTALRENEVSLVLLDLLMPTMDGFEVCQRIRTDLNLMELPVVVVSALSDRNSRISAKDLGADDYLTKPVDQMELLARVRNLLAVYAYRQLREKEGELARLELERLREQLLRADRLATLGTLAAAVGHELNNVATIHTMSLSMLNQGLARGEPPSEEDIQALESVGTHLALHAKQLLRLGRPGPDHAERIDFGDVVDSAVEMLKTTGRVKYVRLAVKHLERSLHVTMNRVRIEQIIVNLINNAADAIADAGSAGEITVSVGKQGSDLHLSVEDTGCGISDDALNAVFDPYFSTKSPDRGTGLGLPVVKQIVESYAGSIAISSSPGAGTRVDVSLPLDE